AAFALQEDQHFFRVGADEVVEQGEAQAACSTYLESARRRRERRPAGAGRRPAPCADAPRPTARKLPRREAGRSAPAARRRRRRNQKRGRWSSANAAAAAPAMSVSCPSP